LVINTSTIYVLIRTNQEAVEGNANLVAFRNDQKPIIKAVRSDLNFHRLKFEEKRIAEDLAVKPEMRQNA
jgi:hypothetical protein